jgi:hypothetical protein
VTPEVSFVDGDFLFRLAGPDDEPELRRLTASTPMPGAITVTFGREPDYSVGNLGPCDVLIARHLPTGALAGVLCRARRSAYVNGRAEEVGLIGGVRIAGRFRGNRLLERGLPLFRHIGRSDMLHYGAISSENPAARRALTERPTPGFPVVRRLGGILTLGMVVRRRGRSLPPAAAARAEPEEIADFLARHGPRRQLFPAHHAADLTGPPAAPGLSLEDFVVLRARHDIAAVAGLWDQRAFKQSVVRAYSPALRRLRPAHDLAARVVGARPLPAVGEEIASAYAALVCVAGDDPRVFAALLRELRRRAAERGLAYLMVGLSEDDPLLRTARRSLHIPYRSDLFVASWEGDPLRRLDDRIPHLEIATL